MRRTAILLAGWILLIGVLASCAMFKPIRVMSPEAFGLTCPSSTICVENIDTLAQANRLRSDAVAFVEKSLSGFIHAPRVIFCSTQECFQKFGGNPGVSGQNVGTYGAVINVSGWNPYIVRHELIHHWQNENFGTARAFLRLPNWYIEGMAYSLSEDPRRPIPHAASEASRVRFNAWISQGNDWRTPPK